MATKESSELEEIEKVLQGLSSQKNNEKTETIPSKIDDEEDEVIIVQSNIYKYHGDQNSSLDYQVSEGILKFDYHEEEDDEIIEIIPVEKRKDDNGCVVTVDDKNEYPKDVSEEKVKNERRNSGAEKFETHTMRNGNIKTFGNGNFFMLAD